MTRLVTAAKCVAVDDVALGRENASALPTPVIRVTSRVVSNGSEISVALVGRVIDSEMNVGVKYRLVAPLGEGGMGIAFYAVREGTTGVTPAVLKVVKPEIVSTAGPTALLMIQKEAVALGRLNERVPPTPFVVRFMDTGTVVLSELQNVELPWIAIEYVHGGTEGTTLEQRVEYSVKNTRYAFDPTRAAHAIERLTEGLLAIHDVGVVHRDLTPGNVLCCGFGTNEVPKIADFGIARPAGIKATFGTVLLGTPGYAAPEQSFSGGEVGPWTDVFSFACLVYFTLTGEQYFDTTNFAQALLMVREGKRRSLLEAPALSPELRDNPAACRAIENALARATTMSPTERLPDARIFAASVLPALLGAGDPRSQRASERLVASIAGSTLTQTFSKWTWTVRHPPGDERLVRSVAWDSDGHCLALTTEGPHFWNGTAWLPARAGGLEADVGFRSVSPIRPGLWLLGGENGLLAVVGSDGTIRTLHGPPGVDFNLAVGDPEDLALAVAERADAEPLLFSVAAKRFFRPRLLDGARTVSALARLDETRWLIAGRTAHGGGYAAVYDAMNFDTAFLDAPVNDALTTCAAHVDRGLGVAAGRRGVTLRFDGKRTDSTVVDGAPDLACSAMDVQGRAWVGTAGRLWSQSIGLRAPWVPAWENHSWQTPFVSVRADVGGVTALTVDGAVLEGRLG